MTCVIVYGMVYSLGSVCMIVAVLWWQYIHYTLPPHTLILTLPVRPGHWIIVNQTNRELFIRFLITVWEGCHLPELTPAWIDCGKFRIRWRQGQGCRMWMTPRKVELEIEIIMFQSLSLSLSLCLSLYVSLLSATSSLCFVEGFIQHGCNYVKCGLDYSL